MKIEIHTNTSLDHQVEFAEYLRKGFSEFNHDAVITPERTSNNKCLHVILGPHYAMIDNVGKDCLMIDRCFWGDHRKIVSMGFLQSDKSRIFQKGIPNDKPKPDLTPWKKSANESALVLLDYGPYPEFDYFKDKYTAMRLRHHPAAQRYRRPDIFMEPVRTLQEDLEWCDVAIGWHTSALIESGISGVPSVCLDKSNPAYEMCAIKPGKIFTPDRTQWLNDLSYNQFNADEITSGQFWEALSPLWSRLNK